LQAVLSPGFSYLDGSTGEVWEHERFVEALRGNPAPTLAIDEVRIHIDGDAAAVSARTSRQAGR
jgi:acyl dehydratase